MPGEKSVQEFATNEAIQCTEIYEFVQKLGSPEFEMPTLQVRTKYILPFICNFVLMEVSSNFHL